MPAVQYPFIDIAVHPRIRERFARGEAMALFSVGLDRVLWANGAGADLFGYPAIYDFIEQGAKQGDVSFRQVASTAHQLAEVGDTRSFLIRIAVGFQRIVVNAAVEMVRIQAGETAILFSCPVSSRELDTPARAGQMLEGFDDPDTHMAVIGGGGEIIASSAGFPALGVTPQTASMLVTMAGAQPERMIKRPIPTGQGYLPAAIGRLSDSPALHLLFVVEMIIGHLDPVDHGTPVPVAEPVVTGPVAEVSPDNLERSPLPQADEVTTEALPADYHTAEIANADTENPILPPHVPELNSDHVATSESRSHESLFLSGNEKQTASGDSHAPAIEHVFPEKALTGMLAAISAAALPSEAAAGENAVLTGEENTPHREPESVVSPTDVVPDMVAAISADHLPTEAPTAGQPLEYRPVEPSDAHYTEPAVVSYAAHPASSQPDAALVDEPNSYWPTSDMPSIMSGELPAFVDASEQRAPETVNYLHDEGASEMPEVQAADLAHYAGPEAGILPDLPTDHIVQEEPASTESSAFVTMIDAVANIEDLDDAPEDMGDEAAPAQNEAGDLAASLDEATPTDFSNPAEATEEQQTSADETFSSQEASPAASVTDAGQNAHDTAPSGAPDDHALEAREKVARQATAFLASLLAEDPVKQAPRSLIDVPASTEAVDEAKASALVNEFATEQQVPQASTNSECAETAEIQSVAEMTGTIKALTGDTPAEEPPVDLTSAHSESAAYEGENKQAELQEMHAGSTEAPIEPAADVVNPVEASSSTEASADGEPDTHPNPEVGFVFNRNGRATRFVWKIDAEGRFSEISREFAEAVGPHAKSVAGVAFTDIAALFNLDPDGKIAELLARRDTWSGRTIHWPVEGTTLTVPVDLAALPTYTRSREFDGFRGFGVVRLSDAAEDPHKIGLTLTSGATAPVETDAEPSEVIEPLATAEQIADVASAGEEVAAHVSEEERPSSHIEELPAPADAPPASEADEPELPFNGEPPALKISEGPSRRLSDKIIQLHQHRMNISDSLSPSEQAAFREIAKQLEPFGKRSEPPVEAAADAAPIAADHEAVSENSSETALPHVAANDDNDRSREPPTPEAVHEEQSEYDPLTVLSTAIPPRSKMTDGLSAEVVDQLPVAILVHAGDTLIHANPEFLRLTGYKDLQEVEGIGGLDALLQRQDLHDKTERPGTMVVVRADDVLVPVTARLQSIRWEDGSALMLALMPVEKDGEIVDTEVRSDNREEARPERMLEKVAKLQTEVEELQSILETATDGVAIIGPEGDIRSMNRSASALFNYDEQETRGKPFVMLFAHESQKAVLDYLNGLTGNGVASVLNDGREVIGREASGGFVPLFMTMGVLTSSNGYCAVIRDITQWKRTEEELRNAKRAAETANAHKTDFLARVSHEIRTPLNAIIGFSDMMASERLGPIGHPRYAEYAGDIGRSGRHVLDIVNDLLDISKIEAGEMELEFGSVGLNAAIAEAVSIVQPQANSQRVIIRTALAQSVPNVVADLRSIKQIALNILSNAIRFTPSGGQIVVSTSYEGNGSVVLRIRDTGVGMTRTELEQAMKPFRQVATNSRQRGDGTGLGLPLTKAMVDANRALFAIHSAPNEGTLVEVTFPSQRVLAN